MSNFIPLHIKTGYSFLESGILLDRLLKKASELNYKYLGISDFQVMYGIPEFNELALKNNIKPIFGMDIKLDNYYLSLYVKNEEGYRNLCRLTSLIHKLENENKTLSLDDFHSYSNGLIMIFPLLQNKIFNEINNELEVSLNKIIVNKDDTYIGINNLTISNHQHINLIKDFATSFSLKCIPFPDITYLNKEEAIVIDILHAIKTNTTIEEDSVATKNDEYLKNIDEYDTIFHDYLFNFDEFLSKINFTFDTKRGQLINYVENEDIRNLFISKVNEGVKKRNIDLTNKLYKNRLNKEFLVIKKLGYFNYFLVVQDYINFAKDNNIPVGPGRGSAAGSLISYCLGITDVDPIKYNLLFERFLNVKRNSMPDIDVDISDIRRDDVIRYLVNKYGEDRVSRVSAFQTIAAKQALRDIGRVYGKTQEMIGEIAKAIPNNFKDENAKNFSLDYAYNSIPALKDLIDNIKDYKFIFDKAHLIEGLPRQRGLHAAGVILNETPLKDIMPLDYDVIDFAVTEYEKDYLEHQGFLKMDLLGLSNLTVIDRCLEKIKKTKNISLKMEDIPYDDPSAIKIIKELKTMGIFQLDTQAAFNALVNIDPDKFTDIVAAISLDRPGPMQFIPSYSRRKKGNERIAYISKVLEPVLKETYGIIVYQEQIMQIAQIYSGFNFSEADLFRRAISKKNRQEILKNKDAFIKGAVSLKHPEKEANVIFDQILKFANYGFNKSHAVAYAMIACKEAYLKANYPIEFYSSILDQQYGTNDVKFSKYLAEIRKSKIKVLLPNINESTLQFEMYDNGLLMPLLGISGMQSRTVINIINERNEHGKFKSFIDFVVRMYATKDKISEIQVSKLIDAGAFDTLNSNRKALKMSIPSAIQYASTCIYESGLLLDNFGLSFHEVNCIDDPLEKINNEYNALGVMISDSPLNYIKDEIKQTNIIPIEDLQNNKTSSIVGLIRSIKTIVVKNGKDKGKPMAFITLFDETDEIDCTFFSSLYSEFQLTLKVNDILLLTGYKEIRNNRASFIVNKCQVIRS